MNPAFSGRVPTGIQLQTNLPSKLPSSTLQYLHKLNNVNLEDIQIFVP